MPNPQTKVTPLRTPAAPKRKHDQGETSADAIALRRSQFFRLMNCGPTKGDEMIRSGLVRSVKVGKTVLIDAESARELFRRGAA